jgi:transglutaminase-like putative cysteine protease
MGSIARASDRVAWGYVSPADALAVLNSCILALAAFRGIEAGNITRGPGWHFLNIGRRIERSLQLIELLRAIIVPVDPENWPSLEMLLEVADSSITYRSRYFTVLQAAPVLDLLSRLPAEGSGPALRRALQHAVGKRLAALKAEADGGGGGQAAQCGCRIALRSAHREHPYPPGWPARRAGSRLTRIRSDHCQHVFQPRGDGACHVIYRVRHQTIYDYVQSVSVSHHVVRLTPRDLPGQRCRTSELSVWPVPPFHATTHTDYFGNTVSSFTLPESHTRMTVEATSELEVNAVPQPPFPESPAWETVRDTVPGDHNQAGLNAYQFVFDSVRVSAKADLADYARTSFPQGRPLLEAVLDLTSRIHQDFRFDAKATEVTTPVETFFEKRRGVCQDFSHLQIACMRSLGLPARYVSGYLRTLPPPGRPRLVGSDASHAWCAAWCPRFGWVDFDPTNNCVPSDGHITLAWGRDYSDVSPIRGVLLGGAKHSLKVGVDVMPLE